jgi:hypothetical protein
MKPLTAEDLVEQRNQQTHQFNEWLDVFEIISNCRNLGLSELERHSILSNRFELKQKDTNTYHEPNQTTMNTDYTEQPFNLETALKHPEWVYFRNGEKPLVWNWFEKANIEKPIVIIDENTSVHSVTKDGLRIINHITPYDLILRVPCKEVFINIYPNGNCIWHDTKEEANECVSNSTAIIACVPVKIPAI